HLPLPRPTPGAAEPRPPVRALARTGTAPTLLVAAALVGDDGDELLARAAASATTTKDPQLVTTAAAPLSHDEDLLDALVRDHLADHPDSLLAAWVASQHP